MTYKLRLQRLEKLWPTGPCRREYDGACERQYQRWHIAYFHELGPQRYAAFCNELEEGKPQDPMNDWRGHWTDLMHSGYKDAEGNAIMITNAEASMRNLLRWPGPYFENTPEQAARDERIIRQWRAKHPESEWWWNNLGSAHLP
jgi:hypothetical protein